MCLDDKIDELANHQIRKLSDTADVLENLIRRTIIVYFFSDKCDNIYLEWIEVDWLVVADLFAIADIPAVE